MHILVMDSSISVGGNNNIEWNWTEFYARVARSFISAHRGTPAWQWKQLMLREGYKNVAEFAAKQSVFFFIVIVAAVGPL